MINNFNIVIPLLTGVLYYGEKLGLTSITGLAFMSVAFVLIPNSKNEKANFKWLLFTLIAFFSSGINNSIMSVFAKTEYGAEDSYYFIAIIYLFTSILSFVLSLFAKSPSGENYQCVRDLVCDVKFLSGCFGVGALVGLYNLCSVLALTQVDTVFFFSIAGVGCMVLATVVNRFIFKEKLSLISLVGILCGIVSVFLLNL